MPCYTEPHAYCKHESNDREKALCDVLSKVTALDKENKKILENLQDELKFYKSKSDEVTKMLCHILGNENYGLIEIRLPEGIQEWWNKHKEWDKKRNS